MKFLLDTHILLWAASSPEKLSATMRNLLTDANNVLFFSPVSLWEIVIKNSLGRADFHVDAKLLWRQLRLNGYRELSLSSEHALAVELLLPIHKDPFDRILLAQAMTEQFYFLTVDETVLQYGYPVFDGIQ